MYLIGKYYEELFAIDIRFWIVKKLLGDSNGRIRVEKNLKKEIIVVKLGSFTSLIKY